MFQSLNMNSSQMTRIIHSFVSRKYCAPCHTADPLIPVVDIKRFVVDCFCSVGTSEPNSIIMADALIQADCRDKIGEGVLRLERYIDEILLGMCDAKAEPTVEEEHPAVALVNGKNGLGPIIGRFCMDIAMEKALVTGVGLVAAKGSNHYGMASLYTLQAVEKGYMGLSASNGYPVMVAPGGINPAVGANPISVAAPAHCEDLVLDMSTTAASVSQIKRYERKKHRLPVGWALNNKGEVETDPTAALKDRRLCPLGADQHHKGFGLALVVEAISGILSGSNYGSNIPRFRDHKGPPNIGHSFLAINPEKFAPDFASRLSKFLKQVRCADAVVNDYITIAGDKERDAMKNIEVEGGIRYSRTLLATLELLAKRLGVQPLNMNDVTGCLQEKLARKKDK